jgi:hypothetical protein
MGMLAAQFNKETISPHRNNIIQKLGTCSHKQGFGNWVMAVSLQLAWKKCYYKNEG